MIGNEASKRWKPIIDDTTAVFAKQCLNEIQDNAAQCEA